MSSDVFSSRHVPISSRHWAYGVSLRSRQRWSLPKAAQSTATSLNGRKKGLVLKELSRQFPAVSYSYTRSYPTILEYNPPYDDKTE